MNSEEKANRFKNIAKRRAERVIEGLRVLGNCSNRAAYSYTDEQIDKLFLAIEEQVKLTKALFRHHRKVEIDF